MDLRNSLLASAIERLEEISLDELATKINTAFPDRIGKFQALDLLMGWLHEQIKGDRIIEQGSLLPDFVSLLMCGALQAGSFRKEEVDQALEEWQRKDAEENPANRRRYLMAQAEIQHLFGEAMRGGFVTLKTTSHPQGSPSQHMHKSRAALLQKPPVQSPLGDITNKEREGEILGWGQQRTGSNVIPLGQRSGPNASSKREIIEIEDDEEEQLHTLPIYSRGNPSAHRSEATVASLDSDADELCPTNLDPSESEPGSRRYHPSEAKTIRIEGAVLRVFPMSVLAPELRLVHLAIMAMMPIDQATVLKLGRYTREDTPNNQGAGECNTRGRRAVPSRSLDNRSSAKAKYRDESRPKRNEGRLSYDDDVFIDSHRALQTPKAKTATKQQASGQTESKDGVAKETESEAVITPEDSKRAEEEAEKFLQVMKLEIGTVDTAVKDAKPATASGQADTRVPAHDGADDSLGINEEACQEGDDGDTSAAEDDPTLFQAPDGIQYRLVRESRFRTEVVALFKGRANPIVHSMANRRSARQVWEEADGKNAT
ncbi:hypothetical protein DL766_004804 [Monosporascus sp. MC13-8B]|uniref:Uncharacterized protein n=1 Tax=Monosporascus cannonballus TaxID=155416 RepID=A0ABY0H423_9PEZI|nr:hypothetical protein DL762_007327 [Monosporascus cannonballus]RYO93487.1 hypothetical protein DL763_004390 [Monosporascus cannonballus]RYP30622.1 hypothetical protein DL766_004804 [Monosporascus sp. MC13-8B]